MTTGRLGEHGRFGGQVIAGFGHLVFEDLTDLVAVAVDRRNQNVGGFILAELHDQFGQVGFGGGDAALFQVIVQADFLGRHRLDLVDFRLAGLAD